MQGRVGLGLVLVVVASAAACGEPIVPVGLGTTGDATETDDGDTSVPEPPASDESGGPAPFVCGDGVLELPEQCDGSDLGGKTCALFGHEEGPTGLLCTPDCQLDFTGCARCGDGVANEDEACDGMDLRGETCRSQNFDDGVLSCTDECELDVSGCIVECGNGELDRGEECDPAVPFDCADLGPGWTGHAWCEPVGCTWSEFECSLCGDGDAAGDEMCDGSTAAPNGQAWTCSTALGFPSQGTVSCTSACEIDTSACSLCGNGWIDPGEACDGQDFGTASCATFGAPLGFLQCDPDCTIDTSACTSCGDGIADPGESCDGDDLGGATCQDLGFLGGALACAADCSFDVALCGDCGDGIAVGNEACDGADLGGSTCADVIPGAQAGMPTCLPDCTLEGSACIPIAPGDLVVSEILYASAAMPNAVAGQWFEIHNPGATQAWSLEGCEIEGVAAVEAFDIDTPIVVGPQGWVTFGTGTADVLGFAPDVSMPPGFVLLNGGDTIRLVCGPTVVDEVVYDDMKPWPAFTPGVAIALQPDLSDAMLNDAGESWCTAGTEYALSQLGTPGGPNVCG